MRGAKGPVGHDWPVDELEAVPRCPACHSSSRIALHDRLVDDTFFTAPGVWSMKQCTVCRSAYLDPRPTPDSIGRAYAAYYTHATPTGTEVADRGAKALARRMLQRFSRAYVDSLASASTRRSGLLSATAAAVVKSMRPLREVIDSEYRHLRRPEPGCDRLLDVGCGGGEFLLRARSLGWTVQGVDFDSKAVAAARRLGLQVSTGSIDLYVDTQDEFDVVTCNHVIEHVYNPVELIAAVHRVLKPGGLLWIETPNIDSAGHAAFGRAWRGLEAPRHLCILNYQALVRLLSEAGFVIEHRTPWNIQHIRMMFACGEAIAARGDPHDTRTALLPNRRLLRGAYLEALRVDRREFVSLRARKQPTHQRS